jgi:putative phage-type endonuclease
MITDTSNIIYIDPDTERERWLTYRKSGIGGSDVAGICGISPWSSPVKVYMDKIGEDINTEEKEYLKWGRLLESPIAREYENRTNKQFKRIAGVLQHREYPWAIGSLDGEYESKESRGVLEIKTLNPFHLSDWSDELVPDHYMTQVQWYLFLTGYRLADIAVLVGGQKLILREGIKRNDEIIRNLVQICERFWREYVIPRNPPPVDESEVSTRLLNTMYPESSRTTIELGSTGGDLHTKLHKVNNCIKELEKEKRLYENKLKEMLKTNEVGTINGKEAVTWKASDIQRLNTNMLKQQYHDIYKHCLMSSRQRRFLLKGEI